MSRPAPPPSKVRFWSCVPPAIRGFRKNPDASNRQFYLEDIVRRNDRDPDGTEDDLAIVLVSLYCVHCRY